VRPRVRAVAIGVGSAVLAAGLTAVTVPPAAAAVGVRCLGSPQVLSVASAASYTTYSLDSNGSLWGWGNNYFGEIGNGSTANVSVPLNASGFNSLQAVSAGSTHVLALRQDGTVWAWGRDNYGQLGDGLTGFDNIQTTPEPVQGLTNVVAVDAGAGDSSFAIKSDGTVWAWGRNDHGQLGDGTTTTRAVPTQITALNGFTAVSASYTFTLGLKNGNVYAWGHQDSYGELGSGVPLYTDQLTPALVPNISGATAVSASVGYHSVALKSDGSVWSWGYNAFGQLGNGSSNDSSTPVMASGLTGVAQISAGGYFTLALTSGGAVYGWGENLDGELGDTGAAGYQLTPYRLATISGVSVLSAGANDSVAVTSGGGVYDWGINNYGEVGNGTTTIQRTPYQTSVRQSPPAAPRNLTAVAGNGLAYLSWTSPTSAVTQYVVTPYLNGVAQAQVAAPVTAPPKGAPPGTTTSYTVSGLTQGGNYTFTVAGQNCLGTGAATAQSNHVIPTGPQLNTPDAKLESSRLTDRMSLHVNTFNGNLSVAEHDIGIKGTGLDLTLDRAYNNKAAKSSVFGYDWTFNGNVSLSIGGDGSALLNQANGSQVGFAHNADGSFTAPSGADATLVKNGDGTYTLTGHAAGDAWKFTSVGVVTSHADRNGNTIIFAHAGPGGAVSSITDTQGRVTTFSYNASNLVASVTDPGGRLYQYSYDASQNLTTYTDPANGITRFAYDANHNLTQITAPANRVVTVGYDGSSRATSIGHPNQAGNPTTTFAYNPPNPPVGCTSTSTVVTDADGHTTCYTFDPVGRTTEVTDGLGNKAAASYTSDSNIATYSTGNGAAGGNYGYDANNNLNSATVSPGAHSTLGYTDPNHPFSPTSVTDPQNNTTTFAYDAKGNPTTETDPLPTQNQVPLTYNANGTMATSKDPDLHQTSYGYDAKGNLTSVTPPSPLGAQSMVNDSLSRPTRTTDGKGQATTYAYDALDRAITITNAGGSAVSRVYDADGNPTSMTDSTGTTTMAYDAMGRLTSRATPDGKTVSYTYDGVGNMLTLADPGGTTTYTYNAVNMPTQVRDPAGRVINLGYDANYNRTSVAYPNGVTIYTTYDSANRLVHTYTSPQSSLDDNYSYTPSGPSKASAKAITMRGSPSTYATNGTPSTAVTLAAPTGLVLGDVEIAQISHAANATITSVPSGWTQIRADATGTTWNDLRQTLYSHVAGAGEPFRYTWGLSQATAANGALSAWTGADPASPVETSSGLVNAGNSYATTVGADNPAGYWRLGEPAGSGMAADASPNGINGLYQGGVTPGQPGPLTGDPDTSTAFNGSSGYVGLGTPAALRPDQLTLEAWFKTSVAANMTILRSRWYGYSLGTNASGQVVGSVCGSSTCFTAGSLTSLADGRWHHVVLTKSNTWGVNLYVDGSSASTVPSPGTTYYGTTPGGIAIGRDGDFDGSYFNGSIDEVAIYPTVLSLQRITAHYQAAASAPPAPQWTAPSVGYQNGELDLAFYGGRLFGATAGLTVPANYDEAYDTQTGSVTTGLDTRTVGTTAANTGGQTVTGPLGRWVGQQVLLRPAYDTSLAQSVTHEIGTAPTYDALNRLTQTGNSPFQHYRYSYDGASNRLSQALDAAPTNYPYLGAQAVNYTYNGANELTNAMRAISLLSSSGGQSYGNSPLNIGLPSGSIAPNDQILAAVTETGVDTASISGYQQIASVTSNSPIAFVGTGSGQSSPTSSSYNVTLPSGIQLNDQILLAVTGSAADTVSVAGYQQVAAGASGTVAADARTVVFRRTATGGETQATVTASAGAVQAAVAAAYRGVDPTTPIDATTTGGMSAATTLNLGSLTPSIANERLVLAQGSVGNPPLSSWSSSVASEEVQNSSQSLRSAAFADAALNSTAPTGTLGSTLSTPGGQGANLAGVALTLRPAPAAKTVVFRRTATGGESQVSINLSAGTQAVASVAAYRGVDPVNPIDALTTATTSTRLASSLPLTFTSLTPSVAGEQLVAALGAVNSGSPGSWTVPGGTNWQLWVDGQPLRSAAFADGLLSSTSPTGPLTATLTTSNPTWANVAGAALTLRPASPSYTYDANGSLTGSSDGAAFAYDSADRATSITPAGGSATTFTYRGAGQAERASMSPASRISACNPTVIAGCPPVTTTLASTASFENSQLGVTAETDGAATTYYVRDPRGGLLAELTPSGGPYYYLFDGHGSVVGLSGPSGSQAATYQYDPFGELTQMSGSGAAAINNPWRYVGAYQDGTGLYHMGARYYDPTTGRFTQQDPIVNPLDSGQWNRYTYSGDDPVNFIDTDGLRKKKTTVKDCVGGPIEYIGGGIGIITGLNMAGGAIGGMVAAGAIATGGVAIAVVGGISIAAGILGISGGANKMKACEASLA
jgi:RHS repeat-associated protein